MGMNKVLAAAALATTGAFGVTEAEAGGVQWSVTVGSPFYAPAPVYIPPPPVLYGPPVPVFWARGHHQPRHWDRDGDGIPNRYDHRYTPRWDRDGDGVPNRYDRYPNGRHGWQGYSGGHVGTTGTADTMAAAASIGVAATAVATAAAVAGTMAAADTAAAATKACLAPSGGAPTQRAFQPNTLRCRFCT